MSEPTLALTGAPLLLVTAIRARGSDASGLRDAAHEACHALQWAVKKKWTRDNIHARKPRGNRSIGVCDEIMARAVEQIVCRDLGVDCGTVEHWADVCWFEMCKNERISLPTGGWLADRIREAMVTQRAASLARRVIDLPAESPEPAPGVDAPEGDLGEASELLNPWGES